MCPWLWKLQGGWKPEGLYTDSQKNQAKSTLVEGREAGVNKPDLVNAISEKTGLNKRDSERVLNAFVESIGEALAKGEKVSIPGILSVERVARAARTGRNPSTGETIDIPAGFGVKVSVGSRLKAAAK